VGSLLHEDVRAVPVFIYGLADPGTMTVRYVGKSANPKARFSSHLSGQSYRLRHWLRSLNGVKPRLLILLRVEPGEDCSEAERALIALHNKGQLLNGQGIPGQKKLDRRRPLALPGATHV
jgi:hypothetical protein